MRACPKACTNLLSPLSVYLQILIVLCVCTRETFGFASVAATPAIDELSIVRLVSSIRTCVHLLPSRVQEDSCAHERRLIKHARRIVCPYVLGQENGTHTQHTHALGYCAPFVLQCLSLTLRAYSQDSRQRRMKKKTKNNTW